MNNADRKKIARIRAALDDVPYAHDGYGTRTASVSGFVAFHADMKVVKNACENALFLMAFPDPDKAADEQEADFEEAIKVAEDWIAKRKSKDWAGRVINLS